jgi:hypothetical protein
MHKKIECTKTQDRTLGAGQAVEEPAIQLAVAGVFKSRWHVAGWWTLGRLHPKACLCVLTTCGCIPWTGQDFSRGNAPQHTKLCLPSGVLRVLAQLRVGRAHLEVEQGRRPKSAQGGMFVPAALWG